MTTLAEGETGREEARDRLVKIAFGIMTLVCLAAGLVLYLFPDLLGLDKDAAELVAIAFLLAGFCDYLILRFWDRIVRRR